MYNLLRNIRTAFTYLDEETNNIDDTAKIEICSSNVVTKIEERY